MRKKLETAGWVLLSGWVAYWMLWYMMSAISLLDGTASDHAQLGLFCLACLCLALSHLVKLTATRTRMEKNEADR